MRGELKGRTWAHKDIPVANCVHCNHHIYRDEPHEHHSYADASGNTEWDYWHKNCPKHNLEIEKITIELRCKDCGVTLSE